jgi:hypothetical protein
LKAQKNFTGGGNTFVLVAELYKTTSWTLAASKKYLEEQAREALFAG